MEPTDFSCSKENLPNTSSKMKLALIFLSALVAITHQQFQQQRAGGSWWLPSYYPTGPSVSTYQHVYYNNFQEDIPSFRQVRPSRPISYLTNNADLSPSYMDEDYTNDADEAMENFPYTESRNKVSAARYRPSLPNRIALPNPRFFVNYYANIASLLTKTATFTVTSSLSLTSIKSCIAAANFVDAAAQATACRRKRDILDNSPEDLQFSIIPSETEKVTATAIPSLELIRDNRQMFDDNVHPGELSGSISAGQNSREKRFFKYSVTSITVTSYSLLSTTITKTVALAGAAEVACLPSGYVVC